MSGMGDRSGSDAQIAAEDQEFCVTVVETATMQYTVSASSADEARQKVERGEYREWRDLGHDDPEVIDVKLGWG